jgi:N-methylhydantoinase A
MPGTKWIIGIDIGGTFTDGVATSSAGESFYSKVPTTPEDLAVGVIDAVEALAASIGISTAELLRQTVKFAHGQTATINAMVQRRGARTGLIATRGFGDTLHIMNISRGAGLPQHEVVDVLRGSKPAPLIRPELVEEVTERADFEGAVVQPLDEADVRRAVQRLLARGVEAIAVSLLWSFRYPAHEQRVREIVAELAPRIPVTLSSEIAPVIGEYERTFTSAANAYLAPALNRYVHSLRALLQERGLERPCLIMQSNGGLIPAEEAPAVAVTTIVSGLSGGVMGSVFLADLLGFDNIITSDMGGTSFEVSIVLGAEPAMSSYPLAPRMGPNIWRWRMAAPTIDITAIGSGGGSIAWIDEGTLKVGPLSAQADPGPACYGRGGTEPTITDADLVLGYLNPDYFLGGRMQADIEAARNAISKRIAEPLGISVIEAARGIVEVANHQMADLMRHLTVNKGHDPRDFHLIAFGGAGPLHVSHFGPELGVRGMLVPGKGFAAAHSALGVAIADYRQVFVRSEQVRAPFRAEQIEGHFAALEQRALGTLASWGVGDTDITLLRSADMRYSRQVHVVEVAVPGKVDCDEAALSLVAAFEDRYESLYGKGTAVPEAGIEITNFRLTAIGAVSKPSLRTSADAGPDPSAALKGRRDVYIMHDRAFRSVGIYDGDRLRAGSRLSGPCVVEYAGTTVFIQPGQAARIDPYLNILIEVAR